MFSKLFEKYDRLVLFDTETTGLDCRRDEIIEFAAVAVALVEGVPQVVREYDELVRLSPGNRIPPEIVKLTGITEGALEDRGISKEKLCADICGLFEGNPLLLAYNAHFDLSFLYYFLLQNGGISSLKGKDKLDLLTVYRDRRPYPHRLKDAITAYDLGDKVANSHRAVDDVLATWAVMEAMGRERDDLQCYINLFGCHPKFGVSGKPIASVTYRPQPYEEHPPLYQILQEV